MDKKEKPEVSLPSASRTEAQTILEKQNLIKAVKVVDEKLVVVDKQPEVEEVEEVEVESESDNEEVDEKNVNLDDEFEKVVPFKFKRLSEESIDEVDHEIAEILNQAQPLGTELKSGSEESSGADITTKIESLVTQIKSGVVTLAKELKGEAEETLATDLQSITADTQQIDTETADKSEQKAITEDIKAVPIGDEVQCLPNESEEDKPPVPIQTYLWEDLKRSKEQGGYPWTHLYKDPLGPDDEPEVILTYNHSPRSGRKVEQGTPKSQKKVRIQDEIEVQETQNYINDLSDNDTNGNEQNDENVNPNEKDAAEGGEASSVKTPSKGILKRSQEILENIKPTTSKFDSNSLKKKIKNPLQRIKKMADNQFKKVRSSKSSIKKVPVSKGDIVLNEEVKILKLKESPKSQHREIPSYVVKHQDSEDSIEIVSLDESPMEVRRRKELETNCVTPDEIIDLPVVEEVDESSKPDEKKEQRESTVDSTRSGNSQKEGTPAKREHVYEDIDDYISKFTTDGESVDLGAFIKHDPTTKLQRQDQICNINDPMFDEFSRDLNKRIRKSLSSQDAKIKQELAKKIPKIEDLEKQMSDEDREERAEQPASQMTKQQYLLAPISSIDSTSSDEASRAQLSILAEESESDSNKKKSFEEPSIDRDIESLKDDGSDISTTLIEDELRGFEEPIKKFEAPEELKFELQKVEDVEKPVGSRFEVTPVTPEEENAKKAPEELKALEEALKVDEEALKVPEDEQDVKEDVIVKSDLEVAAPVKISERWSKMSDHEYEPIGDPMLQSDENIEDLELLETQKRKSSNEVGAETKYLRTPTQDSEDNISAQDFQNDIESRFFAKGIAPIVDDEARAVHQENTFDEAVIIDEDHLKRDAPRKRNFMASAQESSKNFHKKIKAQAGSIKSSLSNKMKKKPKETPVAVEVATEPSVDIQDEAEVEPIKPIHVQSVSSSDTAPKSKTFKMPNFKSIKKPTMPKFKKPEMPKISLPDRPDFKISERFSKVRQLGRSKSMKEESAATDSTSFTTPEAVTAEPAKKKFDFGTYPKMLRDKFKRPKLPERGDMSMRSDSPAPPEIEFNQTSNQFAQRGPVASRWPEYDQESGKYQQFNSESDLDRESSIERRMRLDYERSTEEREDFEIVARLMNEEQRQMDEMERENQEIHLMAQQEKLRKPTVERQESDVGSDEDKMLWSGMLNKDTTNEDFEETNALRFDDGFKYNETDINRSYTPQTNQETQSSGSSGTRRRKGVFDDDDDYFLRENRVSNEIHLGDYISSAIKEGLSTPEANALASKMNQFDYNDRNKRDYTPERPIRSLKRRGKKPHDEEEEQVEEENWPRGHVGGFNDFYKTFPPDRPMRKQKKSVCESEDMGEEIDLSQDHQVPDSYNEGDDSIDDRDLFYRQQVLKGLEHPDLVLEREDYDPHYDYNPSNLPVPPTPPRRRKKKMRSPQPVTQNNVIVSRFEQRFIPLAQEEHLTPTPPRRTRSRSQVSAFTLDDAESFRNDSVEAFAHLDMLDKENGYAQVRKEHPSKPVRRKRSTKSLGDRQFATMPHMKREEETPPPRPTRNYSTIGPSLPNKPPRRKSAGSLVDIAKTIKNDEDDYEEILDKNHDNNNGVSQRLKSGEIVKRMKDRPLPPPPRPKREHKKHKKDDGDDEDKFDKDDGAERFAKPLRVETNILDEQVQVEAEAFLKCTLPRQDSDFSEPEKVIEVEVSTQTDPVLDEDFVCDEDEEDIDIDEFLSSDGKMKTLEDILKEEQEAELERARQLAEAENLSRGIQRFRDSSQRSMSERSGRASTAGDRSRSLSRPITPSAVVVEQKKSSPIIFNSQEQILTEAGLFIHPITYDDYGIPASDEEHLDEPLDDNIDVNNNFESEPVDIVDHEVATIESQTSTDDLNVQASFDDLHVRIELEDKQSAVDEDIFTKAIEEDANDDFDAEMQRKIEEMIESVMNSAREEADWLRGSNEQVVDDDAVDEELVRRIEQSLNDEAFYAEREPIVEETCIQVIKKSVLPEIPDDFELPEELPVEILEEKAAEIVAVESEEKPKEAAAVKFEEAPLPPPRRKSNAEETVKIETKVEVESLPIINEVPIEASPVTVHVEPQIEVVRHAFVPIQPVTEVAVPIETVQVSNQLAETEPSVEEIIRSLTPSRLHLSSLEIDSLSVCSLTAGRIVASEIDSNTIVTNELDCRASHNITATTQPIEFPPGFIEEIVERVRCASRAEQEAQMQAEPIEQQQVVKETTESQSTQVNVEQPPVRPPLPVHFPEYTSNIPPSFYQLRDPSDHEASHPQQTHRRKKHQNKRKDSTSEEDFQRDQRSRHRAGPSNDQSVMGLGGQLARACGNALRESGSHLMEVLRASSKDEQKRDLHIALIILIVIVAGLILMGMGGKADVHHHHWDFFNPPDNHGR